ncbi:16S rRNA (cytidine(1402)-2'-O)-methyltransferase [Denitratimonas sp. CY0512]|uniref:16S rRNA (cytidine(1402)-2'-O)-methyltransferase n=1 Tax=Denitratimonas sp. CY0512 TaxID=3131940 RepID=UPI0030961B96
MSDSTPGRLHVVATPIGNLGDLSPRALETLRSVDAIAAEDTRHTQKLLAAFGARATLIALHDHNEAAQSAQLVARMLAGADIALVSDAGTPLISDPGFRLVCAAREAGIVVTPVPGACAAIAALSVAGIASDRFVFEGFLPNKATARRERLEALAAELRTLIFYESSHRIAATLEDAAAAFGPQRHAVLARELTKRFETVLDGTLPELVERLAQDADQHRGEFVLIVEGAPEGDDDTVLVLGRRAFSLLREHLPPSQAARLAAEISGAPRKRLYAMGDEAP